MATTLITSSSQTITSSGNYRLEIDITSEGGPIAVDADDVRIDLNGHRMEGTAGANFPTYAVSAFGRKNIHLMDGYISGHSMGAYFSDGYDAVSSAGENFTGGGHIIENIVFERCKFRAARVEGNNNIIRNCIARDIGGDLIHPDTYGFAFESYGPGARIMHNHIHEVRGGGVADIGEGVGISISDYGRNSFVVGNTISQSSFELDPRFDLWPAESRSTWGIWVGGDDASDVLVAENMISGFMVGICFKRQVRGILARNTVNNCHVPIYLPRVGMEPHPARLCSNHTDMLSDELFPGRETPGAIEFVEANYLTPRESQPAAPLRSL